MRPRLLIGEKYPQVYPIGSAPCVRRTHRHIVPARVRGAALSHCPRCTDATMTSLDSAHEAGCSLQRDAEAMLRQVPKIEELELVPAGQATAAVTCPDGSIAPSSRRKTPSQHSRQVKTRRVAQTRESSVDQMQQALERGFFTRFSEQSSSSAELTSHV